MAARGADYLEVYRYLLARFPPKKAALMSERVFRGGVLEGGAPFTKDVGLPARLLPDLQLPARGARPARRRPRPRLPRREDERRRRGARPRPHRGGALRRPPVFLPEWFIDIDRLNAIVTHSRDDEPLQPAERHPVLRGEAEGRPRPRRPCAARPPRAAARHRGASDARGRRRGRSRGVTLRRAAAALDVARRRASSSTPSARTCHSDKPCSHGRV